MKILLWHVHGSWTTAFVAGAARLPAAGAARPRPRRPGPGPHLGLARDGAEVTAEQLRDEDARRRGAAAPARGDAGRAVDRPAARARPARRLPRAQRAHGARGRARVHPVRHDRPLHDVPVVHVTHFNAMAWDCGDDADDA